MKYIFFLALLCSACKQSDKGCAGFKTGTFVIESEEEGRESYRFVRTPNTQTETRLSTGSKTVFDVAWLDDCTYTLTFREGYYPEEVKKLKITVKIVKTAGDYMYYESSAGGNSTTFTGKMRKIK
jgi:hypothetical protein